MARDPDIESFKNMVRKLLRSFGFSDTVIEELLREFEDDAIHLYAYHYPYSQAQLSQQVHATESLVDEGISRGDERVIDVIDDGDKVRVLVELRYGDGRELRMRLLEGTRLVLYLGNGMPQIVNLPARVKIHSAIARVNNGVLIIELPKAL